MPPKLACHFNKKTPLCGELIVEASLTFSSTPTSGYTFYPDNGGNSGIGYSTSKGISPSSSEIHLTSACAQGSQLTLALCGIDSMFTNSLLSNFIFVISKLISSIRGNVKDELEVKLDRE